MHLGQLIPWHLTHFLVSRPSPRLRKQPARETIKMGLSYVLETAYNMGLSYVQLQFMIAGCSSSYRSTDNNTANLATMALSHVPLPDYQRLTH